MNLKQLLIIAAMMLIAMMNLNCSGFSAAPNVSLGQSKFTYHPLFTGNQGPAVTNAPAMGSAADFSVAVSTFHSNQATSAMGGNVMSASSVRAVLIDSMGKDACTISDQPIRDNLVNKQMLMISNILSECPTVAEGNYNLRLTADGAKDFLFGQTAQQLFDARSSLYNGKVVPFQVKLVKNASGQMEMTNVQGIIPTILLANNPGGSTTGVACPNPAGGTSNNGDGTPTTVSPGTPDPNQACSVTASPLIVQINIGSEEPRAIELTSPLQGVMFDILGANSSPQAHAKKLISWFTKKTVSGNYYIVLPNSDGRVDGVDQMFGNNTQGPDGKFAANGYEALRKWDGRRADGRYDLSRRDGLITHADEVFSRLRLWEDKNADGIADPSELHSLSELGVSAIHLDYDSSFLEKDVYGNEIRLKSSVETSDGAQHVMYDIWFRIIPQ